MLLHPFSFFMSMQCAGFESVMRSSAIVMNGFLAIQKNQLSVLQYDTQIEDKNSGWAQPVEWFDVIEQSYFEEKNEFATKAMSDLLLSDTPWSERTKAPIDFKSFLPVQKIKITKAIECLSLSLHDLLATEFDNAMNSDMNFGMRPWAQADWGIFNSDPVIDYRNAAYEMTQGSVSHTINLKKADIDIAALEYLALEEAENEGMGMAISGTPNKLSPVWFRKSSRVPEQQNDQRPTEQQYSQQQGQQQDYTPGFHERALMRYIYTPSGQSPDTPSAKAVLARYKAGQQ